MNNTDVIISFIGHRPKFYRSMSTNNNKLYSYNTCIAQHTKKGIILNLTKYDSITSKHQKLLKDICIVNIKVNPIYCILYNVPYNVADLKEHIKHSIEYGKI